MVRGQGQKVAAVLLGFLVFAGVVAGSAKANAAGKPAPELDVESIIMPRLLAEQYGLTPEDLTPLRQAGIHNTRWGGSWQGDFSILRKYPASRTAK
ncbi:MAG: hypothetical protein IMX01_09130 [Limnochordaceae bacterium]|nr:hypothetical protein [Limnochordaceae bacterium]